MNILFATSEVYPLVKTGGLADVSNNLPIALKNRRQAVRVLVPAYQSILTSLEEVTSIANFDVDGHSVRILETHLPPSKLKVWLVDCPEYFDRPGSPYVNENGQDWPDNAQRFDLFCKVAARVAANDAGLSWLAQIVHCNDWQTGLVPVYLRNQPSDSRPRTVFTIHNLAFQGLFPYETFQTLKLPDDLWHFEALEYHGQLSFIKGGLVFADRVTTVSPSYAKEVTTAEFGYGLEGLLQSRGTDFLGILNGIDEQEWNPQTDTNLLKNYSLQSLNEKRKNKVALQRTFNLPTNSLHNSFNNKALLVGVVSRLYTQKGIDLLLQCINTMSEQAIQFVVLGTGDTNLERGLNEAASTYPDTVAVKIGYDEKLAHQIVAGADVFAMPSRYEPCGLTQLYSLKYGTLPLVRNVGGLADTVADATPENIANNTADGFVFDEATAEALQNALRNAVKYYADQALWKRLQTNAMRQNFSWGASARNYLTLYQSLLN